MLSENIRAYHAALVARRAAEETVRQLKEAELDAETVVIREMEAEDIHSITVDGFRFSYTCNPKGSVLAEKREAFIRALKRRGFGDLVKAAVAPQTLNKFVKDQITDNGGAIPPWFEGLVSVYLDRSISVRKQ